MGWDAELVSMVEAPTAGDAIELCAAGDSGAGVCRPGVCWTGIICGGPMRRFSAIQRRPGCDGMSDESKIRIRPIAATDPDLGCVEIAAGVGSGAAMAASGFMRRLLHADCLRSASRWLRRSRRRERLSGFAVAGLMPPEAELESIAVAVEYQRRGSGAPVVFGVAGRRTSSV